MAETLRQRGAGLVEKVAGESPRSSNPTQIPSWKDVSNSLQEGVAGVLSPVAREDRSEWVIRPWDEFFSSFKSPDHIEERIKTNLLYYRANYLYVIVPVTCVLPMLTSQVALVLLMIAVSVGFWIVTSWEGAKPQDRKLMKVAAGLSALFIALSGTVFLMLYGLALSILLVVAHAVFRSRTLYSRMTTYGARKSN